MKTRWSSTELADALPNGHEKSIAQTMLRSIRNLGTEAHGFPAPGIGAGGGANSSVAGHGGASRSATDSAATKAEQRRAQSIQ